MREIKVSSGKFRWTAFARLAAAGIFLTACVPGRTFAQQPGQKTYASAEEASNALFMAIQNSDEKAILEILGPEGKQIVSSGDNVEDAESRANFTKKYQEMHRLMKEPDGTTTLYIGAENWPAPIPLMNKGKAWYFDTEMGKKEILYRRVGRNEMWTIHICEELVAAQKEYFSSQGGEYAQQVFSDEGKHNGLYWKAGDGEPQSPIGPQIAAAVAEGYNKGAAGPPTPYHGYLYHVMPSQGKNATGGVKSYVVDGKMTGGFAFVAYPAEYRSSGVMTFIVSSDGVVYQKDLGKKTEVLGKAMKSYDLDASWKKAVEEPEEASAGQKMN